MSISTIGHDLGRPRFAVKIAPSRVETRSDPHLIHASLRPPESTCRTASRWIQPFLRRSRPSVRTYFTTELATVGLLASPTGDLVYGGHMKRRLSGRVDDVDVGVVPQQHVGVVDLAQPGGRVQRRRASALPRPLRVIEARLAASIDQQRQHVTVTLPCRHTRTHTRPLHRPTVDRVKKGKGFPYSTPSVGPGADPGVQAVSLQVTVKSSTRR